MSLLDIISAAAARFDARPLYRASIAARIELQNRSPMSLDVYLETPSHTCPACNSMHGGQQVYAANITHNLNVMASAAGLYDALWHPELQVAGPEIAKQVRALEEQRQYDCAQAIRDRHTATAHDLIEPLRAGLARLVADPQRFKEFNPKNGWGRLRRPRAVGEGLPRRVRGASGRRGAGEPLIIAAIPG